MTVYADFSDALPCLTVGQEFGGLVFDCLQWCAFATYLNGRPFTESCSTQICLVFGIRHLTIWLCIYVKIFIVSCEI